MTIASNFLPNFQSMVLRCHAGILVQTTLMALKARPIGSLSLQRGQESVYGFVICGSNTHTKLPAYTRLLSSKLLPKKSALNSLLGKKKKKKG